MENMNVSITASLLILYEDGKIDKLKMRDAKGDIHEEISLPILDYMLSSYSSLDRYLEKAFENHWIPSKQVTLKIVDQENREYPLPFETAYNDIIYKCAESAIYKGQGKYIENGNANQTVSNMEFQDFFQDFISNVLDDGGFHLIEKGYFSSFPVFSLILKEYYTLMQKEDDMYAMARANKLEKNFPSIRIPRSIDDYLRNYDVFRTSISFLETCKVKKQEKGTEKELDFIFESFPEETAFDYAGKRSLCYIIGNNCEPLILKTMPAEELDHFIIDHYANSKEIKREYRNQIENYILEHKDYVTDIRNQLHNSKYSGQLSILAYDKEGKFVRTPESMYLRYPIIYSSAFKSIRSLYCNIDKFRKEAMRLHQNMQNGELKLAVEKTRRQYEKVEEKFCQTIEQLEKENKATKEQLEETVSQIKKIVEDMKELEQMDYQNSLADNNYRRIFSKQASNTVRFVEGTIPKPEYKKILDSWFVTISSRSCTNFDEIRIILRELRKKMDIKSYESPDMSFKTDYKKEEMNSNSSFVEESHELAPEKEESFLSLDEIKEMYGEIPNDDTLRKENIHVHK
jgi:hypothetical protein